MNCYFFDTSALIKRYVVEIGSAWAQTLADPAQNHKLFVSRITWVEVISGLTRLHREGKMNAADFAATLQNFRYDWETQYQIVEIDPPFVEAAGLLIQKHFLRAYDSIQLAAAMKLLGLLSSITLNFTFISADDRLLIAAQAEGMTIENPNNHP